jgi:hypothetical protein
MKIIITEEQKKKLFIPRRIDQREIEAEELKQKFISEIKEIIEEEGMISIGELDGNPIEYDYEFDDELAQIEEFYSDYVIVIVYGGYKSSEEVESFQVNYDELNLEQIVKIRELLETYDSH